MWRRACYGLGAESYIASMVRTMDDGVVISEGEEDTEHAQDRGGGEDEEVLA